MCSGTAPRLDAVAKKEAAEEARNQEEARTHAARDARQREEAAAREAAQARKMAVEESRMPEPVILSSDA